eukprot:m.56187 g.56187  ORF g.56187 m.56187 type:complete len:719 (+) comp18719_c0_seq2:77-2233(+)
MPVGDDFMLNRARTFSTADLLRHDMRPLDSHRPRSATYQPSQGPPARDHRLKGYVNHQMLEEHKGLQERDVTGQRHYRAQNFEAKRIQPGHAANADEFYAGKHSTKFVRKNPGLNKRFQGNEDHNRLNEHKQQVSHHLDNIRDTKRREKLTAAEQKKRDMEQLRSYNPWGKPGGGAPKNRHGLINQDRLHQETAKKAADPFHTESFGKPGGGNVNRTASGKPKTQRQLDADTQFANVFRDAPAAHKARYDPSKPDPNSYRQDLDAQAQERQFSDTQRRKQSAVLAQSHLQKEMFGRPGAGAPVRDKDGNLKATKGQVLAGNRRAEPAKASKYAKDLEQQVEERQAKRQQEQNERKQGTNYAPWGSGVGNAARTQSGRVKPRTKPQPSQDTTNSIVGQLGKPGGGNPSNDTRYHRPVVKNNDAYDPWGKPGAGAPVRDVKGSLVTRTTGRAENDVNGVAENRRRANDPMVKHKLFKEQAAHLQEQQERTRRNKEKEKQLDRELSTAKAFEWGKGASNPKRDPETGELLPQKRPQSDVIGMQLDKGGGLGRKQKNSNSKKLHDELSSLAADKMSRSQRARAESAAMEKQHMQNSGKWQGKGFGAPRRDDNGEIHGRFALDNEVHFQEVADTVKTKSKQERLAHKKDLDSFSEQRASMRQRQREMSAHQTNEHLRNSTKAFGKQANGAPLRTKSGKVETKPAKVRPTHDVEWKLNASQKRQ